MPRARRAQSTDGPDAFFAQPPEAMLAALDRPISDVVSDTKAQAFGDAVEAVRKVQRAGLPLAFEGSASPQPMPVRNAIEVATLYRSVQETCQRIAHEWSAALPRGRTKQEARHHREAAASGLREQLRSACPQMADSVLAQLADTWVHREDASQARAQMIGEYVGGLLSAKAGASTVRAAAAEAQHARDRWKPFLAWITAAHPTLLSDMTALAQLLEWYRRWTAGPIAADYYPTLGPLLLDLYRMNMSAPSSHPLAPAVLSWLRSLTDAEVPT